MQAFLELGLVLLLILLNAFFAASEMALITARKGTLRDLAEKRVRGARSALRLVEHPGEFLATIQVGVTVAGLFASAVGAVTGVALLGGFLARANVPFISDNAQVVAFFLITGSIAYLTLVLGELVPKNLAIHYADRLALVVAPTLAFLSRIARPLVALLTVSTNLLLRPFGIHERVKMRTVSLEEIESLVEMGEEEGVLHASKADMIHGIFELSETKVREIMIPRIDMIAVPIDATVTECISTFTESGHSRLPVYEKSVDNVVGLIQAKDFLPHFGNGAELSVRSLMRAALYVPEGKKVDELLQEMKRTRSHMAIVVDEFGGTAGLVTLEDIVEEVVGEISDEYDLPESEIQVVSENELITSGRVGLDEINDRLEIELQKEDFDSIGGLVMNELGRLPMVGDRLELEEATVEVLAMAGRRIKLVRITRRVPKEVEHEARMAEESI